MVPWAQGVLGFRISGSGFKVSGSVVRGSVLWVWRLEFRAAGVGLWLGIELMSS